ncbi:MAG: endolytic transglycosylase MltG [Pseudomonadota bacterium]|jgi:UPF0755 protein
MVKVRALIKRLALLGLVLVLAGAGSIAWWANAPLRLPAGASSVDLGIEPGTRPAAIAQAVAQAGVDVSPPLLFWWFRVSGQARSLRAGGYEITSGMTPAGLTRMVARGEESLRSLSLIEGWTWQQVRQALARAPDLKHDSQALSNEALMQALGRPGAHPEGLFYPDTYSYAKGSSELALLKRAMRAMDNHLAAAWAAKASDAAVQSPAQALILASIIEKETGRAQDRAMISSVFNNRLRIGMRLQTDPTVIYGLGPRFDGNLRKADLLADTPYNTYTRAGLPPTPIAMPGKASLWAAVQPAASKSLYFVARGDGSSAFSASLEEHNRAVNQFQLRKSTAAK